MKNILIPTDFSQAASYGIEFAANLAKKTKAKLHLFNAAETNAYYFASDPMVMAPPAAVMMEGIDDKLKSSAMAKLEKLIKNKIFSGLNVTAECETTPNIPSAILEQADNVNAELIVMGTKGSSGIPGVLLGSTAERVVRFSEKPVVVVPEKMKSPDLKLIVFATDFKEESHKIFPLVQSFAKIFKAKIHLLKINTTDQFSSTRHDDELIAAFTKKFGNYEHTIYNEYLKEEGILTYSDKIKADLIAIGTHGKTGLRRFFSDDVSEGVVRLSRKPIFIANLKKQQKPL